MQAKRPMEHLLIKGRNLYRLCGDFGTLRQPWQDESAWQRVLDEKHERKRAARSKHGLRKVCWGVRVCVCGGVRVCVCLCGVSVCVASAS